MTILPVQHDITETKADLIAIPFYQKDGEIGGQIGQLNKYTDNLIAKTIEQHDFDGSRGKILAIPAPKNIVQHHLILIGLGVESRLDSAAVRYFAGIAVQQARAMQLKSIALLVPESTVLSCQTLVEAITQGIYLANYRFDRYKTVTRHQSGAVDMVELLTNTSMPLSEIKNGIELGESVSTAVLNARDIINEPPSKIKPSSLVDAAQEIAGLAPSISVTVLNETQLKKEGYNTLLAVASGSEEKPYLIHLHYTPSGVKPKSRISLVGKGVTFDSGGLGIKPAREMQMMKTDMAGAAAVLGTFQVLAELEMAGQSIDVEVDGIIATTENMISGKAMRPDDIIVTKSGKTVEIVHTDAEGRLILADALTHALAFKPNGIIDIATLTGAAIKAVGRQYAVYMGNDKALLDLVRTSSIMSGEKAWELPLPDEYHYYVESDIADLQNLANDPFAPGAILGGLFLQEFVGGTPWVHIDIAGPSYTEDDSNPLTPKGATGYGVLLLVEVLKQLA